jgi:uncharacterized protein (TIGR02466 family)
MNDKIKQIGLVHSDLFLRNVGTEEQRSVLISEIKEVQKMNPDGIDKSNENCWRWNNPCKDVDWICREIIDVVTVACNHYENLDPVFKQLPDLKTVNLNYWANVNGYMSRNFLHAHRSRQFSVVYYLQGTGTGEIVFTNPANIMSDCNWGAPFVREFRYKPQDGDLLVWPAWMPHEVDFNLSNRERINLVFDVDVKEQK